MTIIGSGEIGQKARQLDLKNPKLRELGYALVDRYALAEDFINPMFPHSHIAEDLRSINEANPRAQKLVERAGLTHDQIKTLHAISRDFERKYPGNPLAVRFSGAGDSRGTGNYLSEIVENDTFLIADAFKRVVGSYFSKDAVAFRKAARHDPGMGVLIEPMTGEKMHSYKREGFAPLLSGNAFTSTPRDEKGVIRMNIGFGSGVEDHRDLRVTMSDFDQFYKQVVRGFSFNHFLYEYKRAMRNGHLPYQQARLLLEMDDWYGNMFRNGRIREGGIRLTEEQRNVFKMDVLELFDQLRSIEDAFGTPQYFEWGMTMENGAPRMSIHQIADAKIDTGMIDVELVSEEDALGFGAALSGNCDEVCKELIFVNTDQELEELRKYNAVEREHNFAVIYNPGLIVQMARFRHANPLSFADIANATILIDGGNYGLKSPYAHWGGALRESNKPFGVLDINAPSIIDKWSEEMYELPEEQQMRLPIYPHPVRIVMSEKRGRMVILPVEEETTTEEA